MYFGANEDPGNTDESVKFPSAVALVWRWTGDNRFLDDLYDFSYRAMRYVTDNLDADKDGWPEGLGNVEREGMGEEKLDNAVYLIRGLYDLADMARAQDDDEAERWATSLADRAARPLRRDLVERRRRSSTRTRSTTDNQQVQQQHWIGVTPMEVELTSSGTLLGLAPTEHGLAALAERDGDCFSGRAPFNLGLFHTGCEGGPEGKGERIVFSLNTAIKAVADGNYGRREQRAFTDANAIGLLDEQPGALPEILPVARPEPQHRPLLDLPRDVHAGLGPLRHRLAGHPPAARRAAGARAPAGSRSSRTSRRGQTRIAGANIRLGDGAVAVRAEHRGRRYTTTVTLSGRTGVARPARRRRRSRRARSPSASASTAAARRARRFRDDPPRRRGRSVPAQHPRPPRR